MKVLVFGQLKEFTGSDWINVPSMKSTGELNVYLNKTYPGIADVKYIVAVDKEVVQSDTELTEENIIALLPPYAGG